MIPPTRVVSLDQASEADSALLSNLLELYIHDMSEVFPHVQLGPDGRFGYSRLPLYWSEPDRRFAFVIRCDGKVGGFILVTRGSPAETDPNVLDVAEFFVLRQYRRAGTGREAAALLWNRLHGRWIVRVLEKNAPALAFWRETIATFTGRRFDERRLTTGPNDWRVLSFDSGLQTPGASSDLATHHGHLTPGMRHSIAHVALLVRDYDEAIAFYTQKVGFTLVEDTYQPEQDKRWVVVAPAGSSGTTLLLARASTPEQAQFIGDQAGGRVFLFLRTDDFWRDYNRMTAAGVRFVRPPNVAAYGTVAVFEDLYGNRWDLIEHDAASPHV